MLVTASAVQGWPQSLVLLLCAFALAVSLVALFWVKRLDGRHTAHEDALGKVQDQLDDIRKSGQRTEKQLDTIIHSLIQGRRD
nr:hypothetical protein [uncultured Acetobacter sp.]